MKICHVTNNLPGYHKMWGGAEQAVFKITKLLEGKDVENIVFSTKPIKEVKEDFEFYSIPLIQDYLGEKIGKILKRPIDFVSYFRIYRLLKKTKPDIVHLHNFGNIGLGAVLAAKRLNIPVVFSVYDYWCFCPLQTLAHKNGDFCTKFHGPWCIECLETKKDFLQKIFIKKRRNMFEGLFFKKVDKFIALSEFVSSLLQKYGIEKRRIRVIRLPIEVKETKRNTKIEKNSILFAGWIVPRKGANIGIEAMRYVLKKIPDAKLCILGKYDPCEKEYLENVQKIIKENNLEDNVKLIVETGDVEKFFETAEMLIVPEQWQNMSPLIVTEGMMEGKVVIASRLGGIPELIKDRETGLLAKHNDPKDFADKIVWVLKNKNKAKRIEENARKESLKMFDKEKIARDLIKLYKSLIKRKSNN